MIAAIVFFAFTSSLKTPADYLTVVPTKTNLTGRINTGSKVLRMEDQIWLQEAIGERIVRLEAARGGKGEDWWKYPWVKAGKHVLWADWGTLADSCIWTINGAAGISAVERAMRWHLSPTNNPVSLPRYVMDVGGGYANATVVYKGDRLPTKEEMAVLVLTNVVGRTVVETPGMTNFLAKQGRPLKLKEVQDVFDAMKEYGKMAWTGGLSWSNEFRRITRIESELDGNAQEPEEYTNTWKGAEEPLGAISKIWQTSTGYRNGRVYDRQRWYNEVRYIAQDDGNRWLLPVQMACRNHEDMADGSAIVALETYVIAAIERRKYLQTGIREAASTNESAVITMKMGLPGAGVMEDGKVAWRVELDMEAIIETGRRVWGDEPQEGLRTLQEYGELDEDGYGEKSGMESWDLEVRWVTALGIAEIANRTEIP